MNNMESPLYTDLPTLKFEHTDLSWRKRSACIEQPEAFFDWRLVKQAKSICETCPVKTECLEFALANNEQDGVWGGLTPKERKSL